MPSQQPRPRTSHREFGLQVARLGQRLRRTVDTELSAFGLTDATWRPLYHLGRMGNGVRQKDLARALSIEGPSLVRLLDNLERAGLIARREDPDDRRAKGVHMTEAGQRIYQRVVNTVEAIENRILGDIPETDVATCLSVLGRLERTLRSERNGE
jgi:MarR family transcriptional regulator for hemolysin